MIKIEKILDINDYQLSCLFNNGLVKKLNILPIIEEQNNLKGIEKLKDKEYFKTIKIGMFGELFWKKTIQSGKEFWDYDISPEFAFYNGK